MSTTKPVLQTARDSELPPPAAPGAVAPETLKGRRLALGGVLVLAFFAAAWIASPLWVGLMLGTVMAFTAQPLYRLILRKLGGDSKVSGKHVYLAASLVTALSSIVALVIGAASLYLLARELVVIGKLLQERLASGTLLDALGPRALHLLARLHVNPERAAAWLNASLEEAQGRAMTAGARVLQATTGSLLGLLMALVTELYVLAEWPQLALRLEAVLPLDPRHTRALIIEFRDVSRTALIGTVATATIQGMLAAVGYAVAGVPAPLTWGLLTAIASLLPVVGTFLVWVPIGGYAIWNGDIGWGVFVLVWGFVVVSVASDYVIRPRLVGKKGHGHPLLMLVSLVGGIEVMGLAGLIVAPILMSLFVAVLRIYERELAAGAASVRRTDTAPH